MKKIVVTLVSLLLLVGCGTGGQTASQNPPKVQVTEVEFPQLEQTVSEELRNERVELMEEMPDASLEVQEIQAHEIMIVQETMAEVWGSYEEIENDSIVYFQSNPKEEKPLGFYIGLKEPDEKFEELFATLQKKVDDGEILAKYIHFYPITYSQSELNAFQEKIYTELEHSGIGRQRGTFSLSINPITTTVHIDHNMFTEEDQEKIKELYQEWPIEFILTGPLVPGPGEPVVIFPDEEFTTEPQTDGEILMFVGEEQIHTQNTHYYFTEASELKAGMRVHIEVNGPVLESFPAQGEAAFVNVYPNYKPEGATLSEFEVNAEAIGQLTQEQRQMNPLLTSTVYNETTNQWTVEMEVGDEGEPLVFEIEDK